MIHSQRKKETGNQEKQPLNVKEQEGGLTGTSLRHFVQIDFT